MNDYSALQSGTQIGVNSRSMGVKLIVVCGWAVSMSIPAFFVGGLVQERTKRTAEVARQVSGASGFSRAGLDCTSLNN